MQQVEEGLATRQLLRRRHKLKNTLRAANPAAITLALTAFYADQLHSPNKSQRNSWSPVSSVPPADKLTVLFPYA